MKTITSEMFENLESCNLTTLFAFGKMFPNGKLEVTEENYDEVYESDIDMLWIAETLFGFDCDAAFEPLQKEVDEKIKPHWQSYLENCNSLAKDVCSGVHGVIEPHQYQEKWNALYEDYLNETLYLYEERDVKSAKILKDFFFSH